MHFYFYFICILKSPYRCVLTLFYMETFSFFVWAIKQNIVFVFTLNGVGRITLRLQMGSVLFVM